MVAIEHPTNSTQPMKLFYSRRLLLLNHESKPAPPPAPPAVPGDAPQLYSSSKSMALTALLILLVLFFFGFFSFYARRFVRGLRRGWGAERAHSARRRQRARSALFAPAVPRGLDPAAVLALPVLRYVGGDDEGGKEGCVVCLSDFEEKELVKVIPRCGHAFHPDCIDAWLLSRGSCPVCRCSDVFGSCCSSSGFFGLMEVQEGEEEDERRARALGGGEKDEVVGLGRRSSSCSWRGEQAVVTVSLRRTCSM